MVEDGKAVEGEAVFGFVVGDGFEGVVDGEGDGVVDEAVEVVFDAADVGGLFFGVEVFVDDADAAHHRHADGHTGFGDGVHGGAEEGDFLLDVAGESGGDVGIAGEEVGVLGDEGDIVEGESFVREGFHEVVQMLVLAHRNLSFCRGIVLS